MLLGDTFSSHAHRSGIQRLPTETAKKMPHESGKNWLLACYVCWVSANERGRSGSANQVLAIISASGHGWGCGAMEGSPAGRVVATAVAWQALGACRCAAFGVAVWRGGGI